ncbi:unnamed protein product, partial [Allacma fusca]
AEPARMILAYAGAVWKDNRLPLGKFSDKVKNRLKYDQVPQLEFAGKTLVQSAAISRYLAQEFRLTGKDGYEAALCDEAMDACSDLLSLFRPHFAVQDEEKRTDLIKKAAESAHERFLSKFNDAVKANGGHMVGKSFTWADIVVANFVEQIEKLTKIKLTASLPDLALLVKTVNEKKGIKEFRAQRPEQYK